MKNKKSLSIFAPTCLLPYQPCMYVHTTIYVVVPVYPFFVVTSPWSILAFLPLKFQHRVKRKRHNGCITFFCRAGPRNRRCVTQLIIFEPPPLLDLFDLFSGTLSFFFKGARQIIVLLCTYVHILPYRKAIFLWIMLRESGWATSTLL